MTKILNENLWKLDEIQNLEGAQWIFSKITFFKSVHSKEKDEACLGFLENIFTKSVHRGGVKGAHLMYFYYRLPFSYMYASNLGYYVILAI